MADTIKLLHLYPDLMNLYGGYSNIKVLCRHLQDQGLTPILDQKSIGDTIDLSQYDFIYMGAGTENSQRVALADLSRYRSELAAAHEAGTVILFTGNAFDMLGKSIHGIDGKDYEGLGVFDFSVREYGQRRYVGDVLCTCSWDPEHKFVGYVNHCADITGIDQPAFTMKVGVENHILTPYDGIRVKNTFGMHLIGGVLINNPHFMKEVVTLLGSKDPNFVYQPISYPHEEASYQITLSELEKIATNVTAHSTARSLSVPV
ncbi:MAG: hypothetical protein ACOX60_01840 [Massiliimalia sp.]|jgi:CobQ-like glutamine amidotransferase family enzyme